MQKQCSSHLKFAKYHFVSSSRNILKLGTVEPILIKYIYSRSVICVRCWQILNKQHDSEEL